MDVERALGLLLAVKEKEITVREAVELIELVTRVHVKEVLKVAEERGVIKRSGKQITVINDGIEFETPKIKKAACEATCARCGKAITLCYFICFFDDEIGPFGSGCIRKLKLG